MAKLPTSVDLGPAPNADPTQPVANYAGAASVVGQGEQALGQGLAKLGQGVGQYAEYQKLFQYHMASSTLNANLQNLNEQTKTDTNFGPDASGKWLVNRHAEQAWQLQDQVAKSIPDGPIRQLFMSQTGVAVQKSINAASDHARGLQNSQALADWNNPALVDSILKAPDDDTRRSMIDDHNAALDNLVKMGVVRPDQAQQLGQQWAQRLALANGISAAKTGNPAIILNALHEVSSYSPNANGLQMRESGNNPTLVNPLGYAGLRQYGAPRLQTLGVYTPGANENLDTWSKTSRTAPGKWSGTFNIPGFSDVKTLQDFLNNPTAQAAVADIDQKHMDGEIAQRGLDKYIGQTVGGVPITQQSLYNMIHLGGAGGAAAALKSGFVTNPKDANGTTLKSYAQMGSGGTQGSYYGILRPDQREELAGHLVTALHGAQVDQQQQLRLQEQQKKMVSDNAEMGVRQTIYNTTDPTQLPSAKDIVNNPSLTREAQDRLIKFVEYARGTQHDTNTYGAAFNDLFNKVHAPQGDPNRITDTSALYGYVGKGLTVSGMKELENEIVARRTPDGEAEAAMKTQFFKNAKSQISGTDEGLHLHDPKGDELYLRFMAQALPAYEAGKKKGLSPSQMLDPNSPDYLGKSITSFKRPMNQWYSDMISGGASATPTAATDLSTPQAVIAAVQSGKLPRAEGEKIALKNGWIRPNPPVVPAAATPQVPISQ